MTIPLSAPEAKIRHERDHGVAGQPGYEWRAIALLSLGFGLVGLDRYIILPMFPILMNALSLNFGDVGIITGVLAFTWGISALFFGRVSDRIGRRRVVVCAMIVFSALVGISGLARGMASLVILRGIMGFAEGAFVTPAIAATMEAAHPRRRGIALGIQQMAHPLFGLAIAPIFVTAMIKIVDWRWVFATVALPGFIVAFLLARTLHADPASLAPNDRRQASAPPAQLRALFRNRNLPLAMLGMVAGLNALVVIGALLPNYLTDVLHLSLSTMGWVLSANGIGSVAGSVTIPALSDRIGRRAALLCASVLATGGFSAMAATGASPALLFGELLVASFGVFALLTMVVGPIAIEAVPAGMAGTASGLVILVGELFGGGIAPVAAGYLADRLGLQVIFPMAILGMLLGIIVALALRDSRPPLRAAVKAVLRS